MKKEFSIEVPPSFYSSLFINNAFLGQYKNSYIFYHAIPQKTQFEILESILKTNQHNLWIPVIKARSYRFVQWYVRCILLKENKIELPVIDDTFYLDILESIGMNKYKLILEYINDKEKKINENIITSLCKEIHDLFEKQNGLFVALQNRINNLLIKIGTKKLFNYFNLRSFELASNFDPALLQLFSIEDFDEKEFLKFWMIPKILKDVNISKIFQSLFSCAEPYPASSTFFSEGNVLTLINDTICKKKFFADFIFMPCLNLLSEGKVQRIMDFTKEFPDLRTLIVVMEYDFLNISNSYNFKKYIDLFFEDSNLPILSEITKRFRNDISFISYMQDSIGVKIDQKDLQKFSFPKLFNEYLNTIDISMFKDKKMYNISDEDLNKDFNFVFAYKGMYEFLLNFKNQKTNNKFIYILDNIKSEEVLNSIVMDIFSLLFLESKDGMKYCSKDFSYHVITLLLNLSPDNEYLLEGLIKNKFVDFINQHNFDFAKTITSKINKKLYHIAETAEIIYKFENGEPITISHKSNKALLSTEYYLSTNKDLGFMEFLYPEIIARRKITNDPLMLFNTEQIHKILSELNNKVYSNSVDLSSYPLLNNFIDLVNKEKNEKNKFNIEDIVKNEPPASFLVMKDIPEEYKNNKIISYIIKGDQRNKLSKEEIYTINDLIAFVDQMDEYLFDVSDDDFNILFKKAFTFSPIPTDLLNNLYLRKPEIGIAFYQTQILSFSLSDLRNLDPFRDYNSIKGNEYNDKKLDEYLILLLESKDFYHAKKVAIDFNIMPFLENLITSNIYLEKDLIEIGFTFPHLKKFAKDKKSLKQKQDHSEVELINEISSIDEIKYKKLCEILNNVKKLPQISNTLLCKIIEISEKYISSLVVNSIETEINLIISFPLIYKKLMYCKFQLISSENTSYLESFFAKLEQLNKFVQCEFFARYQFQYSLNNFSIQTFGLKLVKTCIKYDQLDLINEIKYVWNISTVTIDSVYNCFKLGHLDNGINDLKIICKKNKLSKNQISIFYKSLYKILLFPNPIDIVNINIENNNKQLNVYQNIKNTLQKMISTECGINYYSPNVSAFLNSLTIIGAKYDLIQFYVQTAQFDNAFNLFEEVNQPKKFSLFLKLLITPAIAFRTWNTFWLKLQKRIDYFEPIIFDFFDFLKKISMNELAFNLQRKIKNYDHAIISGFIIYQECKSWDSQIQQLQNIKILISNSILIYDSITERKLHHQFLSIEQLLNMQVRISLMLSILNVFNKKNEPFDKKLELFSSKENTIYLSSHLLLNLHVGLLFEIMEFPDVTLDEICEYTIEVLSTGEGKISSFFKKIRCFESNTYEKIVQGLIKEIHRRAFDDKSFVEFVKRNVSGSSIRAKIFMEYGFKSEALQLAHGNQELLNELFFIEGKEK